MIPLRGFLNAGRRGHIQERHCNIQIAQQELAANGVRSFAQWRLLVHVKTVIAYRSHEQIHEIGALNGIIAGWSGLTPCKIGWCVFLAFEIRVWRGFS